MGYPSLSSAPSILHEEDISAYDLTFSNVFNVLTFILYKICFFLSLGHANDKDLQLIIGLSVGFGVVLVISAFIVITVVNRKFYTRHIRDNAHYVGSVVTEHSLTTSMYKHAELYSRHGSESEPTDSDVYMLAGTL